MTAYRTIYQVWRMVNDGHGYEYPAHSFQTDEEEMALEYFSEGKKEIVIRRSQKYEQDRWTDQRVEALRGEISQAFKTSLIDEEAQIV